VAPATAYTYFASKDHLVAEVFWRRLRTQVPTEPDPSATRAQRADAAIGDVHGRLDLLQAMHQMVAAEIGRDSPVDWRVIHLGDYVDRGPDSKGVVDFLIAARRRDPRNVMLAGNHDIGFLDFLAEPLVDGLFAHNGGPQTALS
jgi:hypothetical protein